jgi:hypothetical protein
MAYADADAAPHDETFIVCTPKMTGRRATSGLLQLGDRHFGGFDEGDHLAADM